MKLVAVDTIIYDMCKQNNFIDWK